MKLRIDWREDIRRYVVSDDRVVVAQFKSLHAAECYVLDDKREKP